MRLLVAFSIILLLITSCINNNDRAECNNVTASPREIIDSNISLTPLWSITGLPIENFFGNSLIESNNEVIFIASSACDAVFAINWIDGDVFWTTSQSIGNNISRLQPWNITLDIPRNRIYVSAKRRLFAVDAQSGAIIWINGVQELERNSHSVILDENGSLFVEANGDWSINPETGELTPTSLDFESSNLISEILSENIIVSNVISNDETMYFLDSSGTLHIQEIDAQIFHTIQFEPPQNNEVVFESGGIGGSWIAVNGNYIAIYFQDTDILSVYEVIN